MSQSQMRIKTICVYPIKSLQGCTPPSLTATPAGFSYDRRFLLQRVSDEKNMIVGKIYEMCLFTTELSPAENPTKILVRYTKDYTFTNPDQRIDSELLEVPLAPDWNADGLKEREVNLHGSPTTGYEMPDKYNHWFSKRFGYDVRLLYVGENRRQVLGNLSPNSKPNSTNGEANSNGGWFGSAKATVGGLLSTVTGYGEDKEDEGYQGVDQGIGFADCAPFLVVSDTSYKNAAARLANEEVLDVNKFRPNIIVEGAETEFEEDFWAELTLGDGDTRIVLTQNCARCPSLNVDFNTGKQGQGEAGKILKYLQKDRRVDPGMKYSPIFGRYGFLASKGPVANGGQVNIKVGDTVTVSKRNVERTRFRWPGLSTDN